eukprot:2939960-Amphidinium_carterae.2
MSHSPNTVSHSRFSLLWLEPGKYLELPVSPQVLCDDVRTISLATISAHLEPSNNSTQWIARDHYNVTTL